MSEEIKIGEASCRISPFEQKGVSESTARKMRVLTHLYVPMEHRKKGHARKLMYSVGKQADEAQIALIVEPKSYDDGEMTVEQLTAFYRSHGFIELQKEPFLMVRIPVPPSLFERVKKVRSAIQDIYGNTFN